MLSTTSWPRIRQVTERVQAKLVFRLNSSASRSTSRKQASKKLLPVGFLRIHSWNLFDPPYGRCSSRGDPAGDRHLHAYLERKANEVAVLQRRLEGMDGLDHRQLALLRHALRHAGFRYTVLSHQNPSPDCDLPMAGPGGAPRWPDPDRQDPR